MILMTRLFPLLALFGAFAAYFEPAWFIPYKGAIVPLLVVVMLGMGMTLSPEDFRRVGRRPGLIALGVALQYTVMPLAALAVGRLLGLPTDLLAGLVLVGTSPGGTASNVMSYLAKGDVALSVTLTTASTLLAVLATPWLTWLLIGREVAVPAGAMLLSVAEIVLLPVLAGLALNRLLRRHIERLQTLLPVVSALAIVVIIAIIVALNHGRIGSVGATVLAAVVLHNLTGLGVGYLVPRLFGLDGRVCRTLAIEVGMQNSGLAVTLAFKFFGAGAALPGALFSIWHNLSGATLAGWWNRATQNGD